MVLSEDASQALRLLRIAGLFAEQPPTDQQTAKPNTETVGIWERKKANGSSYFQRRADMMHEWHLWANLSRIEPKRRARRVLLLGESAARGQFYDPQFTPAQALEMFLRPRFASESLEIIDLARTNLNLQGLSSLVRSAIALEPDALVIFAGNNWHPFIALSDVAAVSTVLGQDGMPGLKRFAEEQLRAEIKQLLEEIANLYQSQNIPVVWVIPEFNLGDWQDSDTNAPHLPADANRQWLTCYENAQTALRNDDADRAAEMAHLMIALDEGVAVTGLRILAELSRRAGDWVNARYYLESARDALIWDPSRTISPRSYAVAQATLREEANRYGFAIADLPRLFDSHLKGELPDRRLFLDYCHLSSEGIRIAMAATAAALLRSLKGEELRWSALADEQVRPDHEAEAEAALLAAIHNAHWWQNEDIVRYHCFRAAQTSPRFANIMEGFIDFQTRLAPTLMCASAERILALQSPLIQNYLLRYNKKQLDPVLVDAMVAALKKVGTDARAHLDQVRLDSHGVTRREVDLLSSCYWPKPQEAMWQLQDQVKTTTYTHSDYYKAYWPESRFIFVGESGLAAELHLTCRMPGSSAAERRVAVEVNGCRLQEPVIDDRWRSVSIEVPAEVVCDGLNEVTLRWPIPVFPGEKGLEQVIDDLINGMYPSFFPAFGEVHSFKAKDARKVRPRKESESATRISAEKSETGLALAHDPPVKE